MTTPASTTRRLARRELASRALFGAAVVASLLILFAPTTGGAELFPYADKVVHVLLFAVLAWSGLRAGVPVVALAVALIGYAAVSEVVQATVLPARAGDWTDVLADLAGAAGGLLAGGRHARPQSAGSGDRARS